MWWLVLYSMSSAHQAAAWQLNFELLLTFSMQIASDILM